MNERDGCYITYIVGDPVLDTENRLNGSVTAIEWGIIGIHNFKDL